MMTPERYMRLFVREEIAKTLDNLLCYDGTIEELNDKIRSMVRELRAQNVLDSGEE